MEKVDELVVLEEQLLELLNVIETQLNDLKARLEKARERLIFDAIKSGYTREEIDSCLAQGATHG